MRISALLLLLGFATAGGLRAQKSSPPAWYFPPPGESSRSQNNLEPKAAGFANDVVARIKAKTASSRWALWRYGNLVHVEGSFNKNTEVKSLRKTWHALMVGAAIGQNKLDSVDSRMSEYCKELKGKDATATWRHVLSQTSGFDYPYGNHPAYKPGEMWTYSDKNPKHLCNALARVYGKKDSRDHYDTVARQAYFDAIGMRGWKATVRGDGVRFLFDIEDMGRLGLLMVARGKWRDKQLVPRTFVEQLETKQTASVKVNYNGPDDGRVGLDPKKFSTAPYGFMTWVNTAGDYYPGADRAWAFAAGAGGSYVLWNRNNGIVFVGFGIDTKPTSSGIPHVLEACLLPQADKERPR